LVVRPYGQRGSIGDAELAIDTVQVDIDRTRSDRARGKLRLPQLAASLSVFDRLASDDVRLRRFCRYRLALRLSACRGRPEVSLHTASMARLTLSGSAQSTDLKRQNGFMSHQHHGGKHVNAAAAGQHLC